MNVRKFPLLAGLSVLILAVLACTINVGGPAYPDQRIPVSTEALNELQSAMQTAEAAGADSGQVSIAINESQLSSYLAAKFMTQPEPLIINPQAYLQDGQIQIFGTAQQGYLQANIEIVVTAGVDEQGQLKIEITSADFGPLPVPAGLKDTVSAAIQEAYTGVIGPAILGFRLESITVANGTMTIVGRTK
ncbi:MAG: hypothetical protein ABSF99_08285 [Anaerolineales bacterium]|jgi:uncharacterized protein YpmS